MTSPCLSQLKRLTLVCSLLPACQHQERIMQDEEHRFTVSYMLIYFPRLILGVLTKVSLIQNLNAKKKGGGRANGSPRMKKVITLEPNVRLTSNLAPKGTQHCNMCQFWGYGRGYFIFLEAHASLVLALSVTPSVSLLSVFSRFCSCHQLSVVRGCQNSSQVVRSCLKLSQVNTNSQKLSQVI